MTLTCRDNKTVQTFICVETFVPGSNRMKENSFNYLTNLYQLSNRFWYFFFFSQKRSIWNKVFIANLQIWENRSKTFIEYSTSDMNDIYLIIDDYKITCKSIIMVIIIYWCD